MPKEAPKAKATKKRASPVIAKAPPAKKSKITVLDTDDEDEDAFTVPTKATKAKAPAKAKLPAAKPVAKAPAKATAKRVADSDDEISIDEAPVEVAPRARAARGAAKPKAAYVDIDLSMSGDDVEGEEEAASDFEGGASDSD